MARRVYSEGLLGKIVIPFFVYGAIGLVLLAAAAGVHAVFVAQNTPFGK